jgi:hypothetical protein
MVAATTYYCLADIAAEHFWAGAGFIPVERYLDSCDLIVHFATRADAEAAARWMRKADDCHLRVMVVRPGGRPTVGEAL